MIANRRLTADPLTTRYAIEPVSLGSVTANDSSSVADAKGIATRCVAIPASLSPAPDHSSQASSGAERVPNRARTLAETVRSEPSATVRSPGATVRT